MRLDRSNFIKKSYFAKIWASKNEYDKRRGYFMFYQGKDD